jgi:hypothetical protein
MPRPPTCLYRLQHYRAHGLIFQAIIAPTGIIIDLFGAVNGRNPDTYLYNEVSFDARAFLVNVCVYVCLPPIVKTVNLYMHVLILPPEICITARLE